MGTTFFLVRHGIKEKAIGDVPITAQGIIQAQTTAEHISKISIHAIISSPLRRSIETAAYIAAKTNVEIIVDDRLRERANWGDLPEQTFEEFIQMWDKCTREPDFIPPTGDSVKSACKRMSSLLTSLAVQYPSGSNIIIVTHGGLITDYIANTFSEDVLHHFHPEFVAEQNSLVSECSITTLTFDGQNYMIDRFASIEHLLNEHEENTI
ncbi:histidine phosphatase family protein [Paenibacillus polygoni]|uniref:Histidine phosphatase family protein n=1 Tax=Paenibacillus polygoni TaxID=3050112 RepID=A0ABY8X6I0_9BACL|nr:histidine phosphatase family protein [Paenibacillus polygoni]WIV20309.1 histidine phosphatase family protein [Paenibacillus polygoni]